MVSLALFVAIASLSIEPETESADLIAAPAKVAAKSFVTSSKDLVARSALDIPTPNLLRAVLLPRKAFANAEVTESRSLPVLALMSIAIPISRWVSAVSRVAMANLE